MKVRIIKSPVPERVGKVYEVADMKPGEKSTFDFMDFLGHGSTLKLKTDEFPEGYFYVYARNTEEVPETEEPWCGTAALDAALEASRDTES